MDRKQEFSIASKQPDDQKRSLEDRKRLLEIEKIRDPAERQHHQEAIKLRDEKLKIEKERGESEKRDIINREVQKQMLAKEQLQLTMKKSEGLPREQRENMMRQMVTHNVEITHGAELDRHQEQIRKDMNREIDDGIERDLSRQKKQDRDQEAKPSIEHPWNQASRDLDSDQPWKRDRSERDRER